MIAQHEMLILFYILLSHCLDKRILILIQIWYSYEIMIKYWKHLFIGMKYDFESHSMHPAANRIENHLLSNYPVLIGMCMYRGNRIIVDIEVSWSNCATFEIQWNKFGFVTIVLILIFTSLFNWLTAIVN